MESRLGYYKGEQKYFTIKIKVSLKIQNCETVETNQNVKFISQIPNSIKTENSH